LDEGAVARSLSPVFKTAVFVMLGLTVAFFVIAVILSFAVPNPTMSESSAEAWLFGAASSSLAALLGLFAGKVV